MDKEFTRKVKKAKSVNYPRNVASKESNFPSANNDQVNDLHSSLPTSLITDSVDTNIISQSSSFLCSHEKIKIHYKLSSDEMSSGSKPKSLNKLEDEGGTQFFNKICKSSNGNSLPEKYFKENLMKDELLSLDDSLLGKIDLSFSEQLAHKIVDQSHSKINPGQDVCGVQKSENFTSENLRKCDTDMGKPSLKQIGSIQESEEVTGEIKYERDNKSPDIFSSIQEDNEDTDPEDQPWDMSISVEEKDQTQNNENSICQNEQMSPGFNNLSLSPWVPSVKSPSRANDNSSTFGDLLKKTLTNNAHKKLVHRPSPQSLFSSPSSKTSSLDSETFYGLPNSVRRLIKRFKGITKLYEWQEQCLSLPAIEKRKNLVYALPTSGGKTLVAEILVLKEILCREKNVLFVLPYVSIAQEKVRAFSPFAVELGFLVEEYAGSKGAYPPQKRRRKRSVYVATIEKALGLVHSLIECQRLQELGLVVVDELHLIGEPKRGAHLESMLTKLLYLKGDIQVVGMSATIGNLSDIATFLHADVYTQDFRPVELTEYVKIEEELFKVDRSIQEDVPLVFHSKLFFQYSQEQKQQDPDQIGALVQEVVPEHSCLVFCPSKKNCENVALLICNVFKQSVVENKYEEKKALFRALTSEGNGTVCSILRKTLPFGVAYHHSGLTTAERSLLEEAFLAKTICCICCTSTLAAGVNLPARRVILRSPYVGAQFLTLGRYKQMIGRAGRTGMGDIGESFLLCRPQDAQKVGELLTSNMDLCNSQLQGTGLASLIISAVDLSLTTTIDSLLGLCRTSLLSVQAAKLGVDLDSELKLTLNRLVQVGALVKTENELALSKIGKAAVKANLDIETAKRLYGDLQVAQDSLVLLSHLHLLYLVTPYTMLDQISCQPQLFCNTYMALGPKEIQTAKVLGVGEQCIAQMMTGRMIKSSLSQVVHRLYLSLILFELWNQKSIWQVSNKYALPRGLVHNFLISASAFSSSVVRFCEVLDDMWCFKLLLAEMSIRLTHCCTMELVPLMELPAVKIGRAKQLYNAGFKTLNILAKTEPKVLTQAIDHMPRRVAHQIVAAAKLILLSKAESLQEEAEDVLEGLRLDSS